MENIMWEMVGRRYVKPLQKPTSGLTSATKLTQPHDNQKRSIKCPQQNKN